MNKTIGEIIDNGTAEEQAELDALLSAQIGKLLTFLYERDTNSIPLDEFLEVIPKLPQNEQAAFLDVCRKWDIYRRVRHKLRMITDERHIAIITQYINRKKQIKNRTGVYYLLEKYGISTKDMRIYLKFCEFVKIPN